LRLRPPTWACCALNGWSTQRSTKPLRNRDFAHAERVINDRADGHLAQDVHEALGGVVLVVSLDVDGRRLGSRTATPDWSMTNAVLACMPVLITIGVGVGLFGHRHECRRRGPASGAGNRKRERP